MPRKRSALLRPLVALASPGTFLFCKLAQLQETAKRRVTERELRQLNHKIDKLLLRLDETDTELAKSPDEECVVCVTSKATMQTFPCGHCVVCRKCFIKTIQMTVTQRALPLRCVLCRERILRLKQTFHCSTEMRLPLSVSQYSMTSSVTSSPDWELPSSSSLYSVSSGSSGASGASRTSKSSLRSAVSTTSSKKRVTFAVSPLLKDPLQAGPSQYPFPGTPPGGPSRPTRRDPASGDLATRRSDSRTNKVTSVMLTEHRLPPIEESHREPAPLSSSRASSPAPSARSAPVRQYLYSCSLPKAGKERLPIMRTLKLEWLAQQKSVRSSPAAAVVRRLVPTRRGPRRRASPADSDESDRLLPDDGVAESRI